MGKALQSRLSCDVGGFAFQDGVCSSFLEDSHLPVWHRVLAWRPGCLPARVCTQVCVWS